MTNDIYIGKERTALITGASRGLGLALARGLAAPGLESHHHRPRPSTASGRARRAGERSPTSPPSRAT